MITSPNNFLIVGAVLFVLGAIGFLTRRNLILMMLSAELMLHGVSLNLVGFSSLHRHWDGQVFTIFVLTIAACEAGIGLALILAIYRLRKTLDIWSWSDLGERGPRPQAIDPRAAIADAVEVELPRLTPAGRTPSESVADRATQRATTRPESNGEMTEAKRESSSV